MSKSSEIQLAEICVEMHCWLAGTEALFSFKPKLDKFGLFELGFGARRRRRRRN
jgi:hypothetical protein